MGRLFDRFHGEGRSRARTPFLAFIPARSSSPSVHSHLHHPLTCSFHSIYGHYPASSSLAANLWFERQYLRRRLSTSLGSRGEARVRAGAASPARRRAGS
jgi:hypothetical protein